MLKSERKKAQTLTFVLTHLSFARRSDRVLHCFRHCHGEDGRAGQTDGGVLQHPQWDRDEVSDHDHVVSLLGLTFWWCRAEPGPQRAVASSQDEKGGCGPAWYREGGNSPPLPLAFLSSHSGGHWAKCDVFVLWEWALFFAMFIPALAAVTACYTLRYLCTPDISPSSENWKSDQGVCLRDQLLTHSSELGKKQLRGERGSVPGLFSREHCFGPLLLLEPHTTG